MPYLEKVVSIHLGKINHLLRTLQVGSKRSGLKPSKTVYMSWGKGPKTRLRFSKSGDLNIEEAYATHFLKPDGAKQSPESKAGSSPHGSGSDSPKAEKSPVW